MNTVRPTAPQWSASELMSVSEAARYLGMNRVSIYGVMRRGALRYLQIGGSRAIPLSELRAYQDQRQRLLDKKSPRF